MPHNKCQSSRPWVMYKPRYANAMFPSHPRSPVCGFPKAFNSQDLCHPSLLWPHIWARTHTIYFVPVPTTHKAPCITTTCGHHGVTILSQSVDSHINDVAKLIGSSSQSMKYRYSNFKSSWCNTGCVGPVGGIMQCDNFVKPDKKNCEYILSQSELI